MFQLYIFSLFKPVCSFIMTFKLAVILAVLNSLMDALLTHPMKIPLSLILGADYPFCGLFFLTVRTHMTK